MEVGCRYWEVNEDTDTQIVFRCIRAKRDFSDCPACSGGHICRGETLSEFNEMNDLRFVAI